ncbi:hypothetical protein TSUD_272480 [Trifolium subterraneum]|uniref:Uncharacterized protein n=1 Tax=Trifolium subterraneum TaxID=3900 RepID=A0A2Z6NAC3_TRISU|nr:hypothetical protein TSUD_272480 [Trifolium subterraneum]
MSSKVLIPPSPTPRKRRGVGEMAGGAAADCTAVCCCCPCAVLNVVVLAVYSLPAGLFRKAVHRRRRRLMKNGAKIKKNDVAFMQSQRSSFVDNDFRVDSLPLDERFKKDRSAEERLEEVALEKELWARFAGTGFWRNDSQRQPI